MHKEPVNKKESIKELNEQINKLEELKSGLKRSIKGQTKYEYRKQRTRRLVETGALAEKYFHLENLSVNEREELFKMFATFINSNKPNHLKK